MRRRAPAISSPASCPQASVCSRRWRRLRRPASMRPNCSWRPGMRLCACSIPTARRCRPAIWWRPPPRWPPPATASSSGPATDGGYYLIGIKQPHRRLFRGRRLEHGARVRQTLARAEELGLPVVLLPSWYDVDDARPPCDMLIGELIDGRPFRAVGSKPTPAALHAAPSVAPARDARPRASSPHQAAALEPRRMIAERASGFRAVGCAMLGLRSWPRP